MEQPEARTRRGRRAVGAFDLFTSDAAPEPLVEDPRPLILFPHADWLRSAARSPRGRKPTRSRRRPHASARGSDETGEGRLSRSIK